MKTYNIPAFLAVSAFAWACFACSDSDGLPEQPDFIQVSLSSTMLVESGDVFEVWIPEAKGADSYQWTLPGEQLELVSGQGTQKLEVEVTGEPGTIPSGTIWVEAVNSKGHSYRRTLFRDITILEPEPALEDYKTKRYGAKTWMIENLNETGEDGDLGYWYNNDPENGLIYGRLYSWNEAMTGIAGCTDAQNPYVFGYSGTDAAGNSFVIDGNSPSAKNLQVQGVCPDGWHIPNAYDWYDLIYAIKDEYSIPGSSLGEVANNMSGYIIAWDRDYDPASAYNLTNWGFVAAYLKGSGPVTQGGLWSANNTTNSEGLYFNYGGNATFPSSNQYPLYLDLREQIEFNLLPGGNRNASGTFASMGLYSFHWSSWRSPSDGTNRPLRFTVGNANVNFSKGLESTVACLSVRCVANY